MALVTRIYQRWYMDIKKLLLFSVIAFASGGSHAKELPPVNVDEAKRDCLIEGEAGGMQGDSLEQFISECVKELLEYEYKNSV